MKYDYDLVIIGGGSAGMVAAEFAARLGLRAALVERDRIGGDCLWTGCVPSKALIASARAAHAVKTAPSFGIEVQSHRIDTAQVWRRLRDVQHEVAATDDNPEKYRALGVDVIMADAAFEGEHLVRVGDRSVSTRYALICTGSRPAAPPIPGLEETGYLTSETLFQLIEPPSSLLIVGAGPIGIEMAQAMARLGIQVTVLEQMERALMREEPDMADILATRLRAEGVVIETAVDLQAARTIDGRKVLSGAIGSEVREWSGAEILVTAGRCANVESLAPDRAHIDIGARGIVVGRKLRTSARWVYAAGDCAGRYLFTHSAGAEAVTAVRNMFFPGSAAAPEVIPWATFTEPELAHVGLTSAEARHTAGDKVRVFRWQLSHSDRARADGQPEGAVIVVTDSRFRIMGAHILAPSAGEMIGQFTLAIKHKMRLTPDFANLIQAYPTYSTSVSQLAGEATYTQLQKPFLRWLRRLNRVLER